MLVYNPVAHKSLKFQKHWEGPYIVISRMAGRVTYMLRSADGSNKFLTVHRNRLKRCNSEPMPEQQIQHVELPFEPAPVEDQVFSVPAPQPAQDQQQPIDQAVDGQRELQTVEIVETERQL